MLSLRLSLLAAAWLLSSLLLLEGNALGETLENYTAILVFSVVVGGGLVVGGGVVVSGGVVRTLVVSPSFGGVAHG